MDKKRYLCFLIYGDDDVFYYKPFRQDFVLEAIIHDFTKTWIRFYSYNEICFVEIIGDIVTIVRAKIIYYLFSHHTNPTTRL